MDYIERVSAGIKDHASESIDKAREEYGGVNLNVRGQTDTNEDREIEPGETPQDFAEQGLQPERVDETSDTTIRGGLEAAYARSIGFQAATGDVEVEAPEQFQKAEETKERLAEIRMVNEELERQDNNRRYVATAADAPDSAQLYEDDFGKYYYKEVAIDVRPSDVADYSDVKAIVALNDDEKAVKTIEFLSAMYSDPLVDAASKEAADRWLDRHLVLTDDDPGSNDTFSHEFKSQIAELIANATGRDTQRSKDQDAHSNSMGDDTNKERVYVDDPSQAPEDVDVQEGQQGGYYYETEGGSGEGGDGGDGQDGGGGTVQDEEADQAMQEMGIDPQELVDDHVFQTGNEDPADISEQVYNEVVDQVFEETGNFDGAERIGAEAADQARQYAEEQYGDGGGDEGGGGGGDEGGGPRDEDVQEAAQLAADRVEDRVGSRMEDLVDEVGDDVSFEDVEPQIQDVVYDEAYQDVYNETGDEQLAEEAATEAINMVDTQSMWEEAGGDSSQGSEGGAEGGSIEDWEVQEDASRFVGDIESEYDLDDEQEYEEAWQEVQDEAERLSEFPEYGEEEVQAFLDYAQGQMVEGGQDDTGSGSSQSDGQDESGQSGDSLDDYGVSEDEARERIQDFVETQQEMGQDPTPDDVATMVSQYVTDWDDEGSEAVYDEVRDLAEEELG